MPDMSHPMTKIAGFNPKLIHYNKKLPTRLSLLNLIARGKDNLEDLNSYRIEGNGSMIHGIGKVLGKAGVSS